MEYRTNQDYYPFEGGIAMPAEDIYKSYATCQTTPPRSDKSELVVSKTGLEESFRDYE